MTKSKRLEPIVKLAGRAEEEAVRAMGCAQTRVQEGLRRLEQLRSYRQEYAERMHVNGAAGLTAAQVQGYQAFLARLDAGIREQEVYQLRLMQEFEEARRAWQATHIRAQALDKVQVRYQDDEKRRNDAKEQKDTDERALRALTVTHHD